MVVRKVFFWMFFLGVFSIFPKIGVSCICVFLDKISELVGFFFGCLFSRIFETGVFCLGVFLGVFRNWSFYFGVFLFLSFLSGFSG